MLYLNFTQIKACENATMRNASFLFSLNWCGFNRYDFDLRKATWFNSCRPLLCNSNYTPYRDYLHYSPLHSRPFWVLYNTCYIFHTLWLLSHKKNQTRNTDKLHAIFENSHKESIRHSSSMELLFVCETVNVLRTYLMQALVK